MYIQTQENSKKPHFGPDLGPLSANSRHLFFYETSTWELLQATIQCNLKEN